MLPTFDGLTSNCAGQKVCHPVCSTRFVLRPPRAAVEFESLGHDARAPWISNQEYLEVETEQADRLRPQDLGNKTETMYEILHKKDLTPVTKLFVLNAPHVARNALPGHFVIVRAAEAGERIPLTIADYDPEKGTVTIVVQEVGYTSGLLNALLEGDSILDVAGPLGDAAPLPSEGHVVLLGGGFGVAPIYPVAKELKRRNVKVTSIIGARNKSLVIFEDEMRTVSDELYVCTDDGSAGFKGFVTQKLEELVAAGAKFDEVVAIGPMPMMRATAETTRPMSLKTWVSMDPIMVDGTGMCGACRVTVGGKVKFACVDGPFFDAHEVDFDEALRRNRMYRREEEHILGVCRRGGQVQ